MRNGAFTACVDVGGTFVDAALVRGGTVSAYAKVINRPATPEASVVEAFAGLCTEAAIKPAEVARFVYSTTLGINALVEGKGAQTGLITTEGFRDVIESRNEQPYDLYNPFGPFPEPLVPRERRLSVRERIAADGSVVSDLDAERVRLAATELAEAGVESVAVCFLHSYMNAAHEAAAGHILREHSMPHSLSSDVHPEIGEYGRFSTTVVNAYLLPQIGAHLQGLADSLRKAGFRGPLLVVTSGYGMISRETAAQFPVRLLESGPAAGAIGTTHALASSGIAETEAISFDMGGTTAKASIIRNGTPLITNELEVRAVERFKTGSGLLVAAPTVDIVEIGAGGGSIARVGPTGLLTVGPESAIADPGPACYGRGGSDATVTDADLLLGYLNPSFFLGGRLQLRIDAATEAIDRSIARPLAVSIEDAAIGILRAVNANMVQAFRIHAAEKGVNIHRSVMVAIGGAGPVHACAVGRELGLERVLVPIKAGVFSAMGCAAVPPAFDFLRSLRIRLDLSDVDQVDRLYANLRAECAARLADVVDPGELSFTYSADIRYVGQRTPLTVAVALDRSRVTRETLDAAQRAFEVAYEAAYGRRVAAVPVEAVTWRLRAQSVQTTTWPQYSERPGAKPPPEPSKRRVYFPGEGFVIAAVIRRDHIATRTPVRGPAVVEDAESSTVLPPGASATVSPAGLIIDLDS